MLCQNCLFANDLNFEIGIVLKSRQKGIKRQISKQVCKASKVHWQLKRVPKTHKINVTSSFVHLYVHAQFMSLIKHGNTFEEFILRAPLL